MTFNEDQILRAARELVERHGKSALAIARERADGFSKQRSHREADVALRILSALETELAGSP